MYDTHLEQELRAWAHSSTSEELEYAMISLHNQMHDPDDAASKKELQYVYDMYANELKSRNGKGIG